MGNQNSTICLLPPTDPRTLGPGFSTFLGQFNDIPGLPYVHSKVIAYRDSKNRSNWAGHLPENPQDRSTFSEFWNERKGGRTVWLGCFTTTTENTMQANWDDLVWHVWGVAVIRAAEVYGKHLIIWDCDPRETFNPDGRLKRRKDIMFGYQKDFVHWTQKVASIRSVWYNTNTDNSGKDKCLSSTLEWIQKMVLLGDNPVEGDPDLDIRFKNCIQLTRL